MSKFQMLAVSISILNALYTIALFTAKAIGYICIALYVAGELLFAELETAPAAAPTEEIYLGEDLPEDNDSDFVPDWVMESIAVAVDESKADRPLSVATSMPVAVKSIALPIKADTTFDGMKAIELRKLCQAAGVKWRNAHGTNKHLSRSEMVSALTA